MRILRLLGAVMLMACIFATAFTQTAAAATPTQADGTVVVSGLASPRGLFVNDDGSLYVTEAGSGGSEVIQPPSTAPTGTVATHRGYTGKITKVNPDGTTSTIADNLPSSGNPDEGYVGPSGIVVAGGYVWIVTGETLLSPAAKQLTNEGALLRINPSTGEVKQIADLSTNELTNNPQKDVPHEPDTDPYGLTLGSDNNLYATNAAGNDLYKVNPATGAFSVVTVFAGLPAKNPNPERGGKMENDPVPTGIVGSTNGNLYVGLLGGGAPITGYTKVVKVAPDGSVSDFAKGLTYITGVTIGPDQLLYVSELNGGLDFTAKPPMPKPGDVVRINSDGSHQVVAANLFAPSGIDFDRAGNMFVTVNSTDPAKGQVLRFNNVATPTATVPLPGTGVSSGPTVTFAQTGFSLSGTFLKYWQLNNGLASFGFPIDSEREVNGHIIQWMERNRFELHPENAAPYNVELGLLGVEALQQQGIDWQTLPKVDSATDGCVYFAQTGHSLCDSFLSYWQSNGLDFGDTPATALQKSVALYGYPISQPKMETNSSGQTVMTQWFERARFEYYPNNPDQYKVQLGRLGAELFLTPGSH